MNRYVFRIMMLLATLSLGITSAWLVRLSLLPSDPLSTPAPVSTIVESDGTLRGDVRRAKARGEEYIGISSIGCGFGVPSLRDTLRDYTVLVATPVEAQTEIEDHGLTTWYRFEAREVLSLKPMRAADYYSPALPISDEFPAAGANEFFMSESGGTVVVDGVTVEHTSNSNEFAVGRTYLLFVEFDAENRYAWIPWSDAIGVFAVEQGGTLRPTDHGGYDLAGGLRARFGNSIDRVRAHLAGMPDKSTR